MPSRTSSEYSTTSALSRTRARKPSITGSVCAATLMS